MNEAYKEIKTELPKPHKVSSAHQKITLPPQLLTALQNGSLFTQEELERLNHGFSTAKKSGRAIYHANNRPCWDNLDNEMGTIRWEDGTSTFDQYGRRTGYNEGHYVFVPKNKTRHGNNIFVVREENVEFLDYE